MTRCARALRNWFPLRRPRNKATATCINRVVPPLPVSHRAIRLRHQTCTFSSMPLADTIGAGDRSDIDLHAAMEPTPLSTRILHRSIQAEEAAQFLKSEFPIRCAERIRMIESLPYREVPELSEVLDKHIRSFVEMRHIASDDLEYNEKEFVSVVSKILSYDEDTIILMIKGLHHLSMERPEEAKVEFVNSFLDSFLLNRLGTEVLLKQYLAAAGKRESVFDPSCDVMAVGRETAWGVQRVCMRETGFRPTITFEATSDFKDDIDSAPVFTCIPGALSFVLQELLKNSCHATVVKALSEDLTTSSDVVKWPILVIVSADEKRIMIRVSDRAGGIPFEVGQNVWSYLYTTANIDVKKATELAGFGVGLPLSRLYTQYLGGSVNLVSLPGYGTQAYVFLPRDPDKQVEVVPDLDYEWEVQQPMGEFIL